MCPFFVYSVILIIDREKIKYRQKGLVRVCETEKKYGFTDETFDVSGTVLHRIIALKDFGDVKRGELGGYVEKEKNLSHKGNCWVYHNACVLNEARVIENASVYDSAIVKDAALIKNNAMVFGHAQILDNVVIKDTAKVYGNAKVCNRADISGNATVFRKAVICDEAKIKGCAMICGHARVGGNSLVRDEANISGYAEVGGNAKIGGNTNVCDRAKFCLDARVGSGHDYIYITGLTGGIDAITFFKSRDYGVCVSDGFREETLDEWSNRVKNETSKNNIYPYIYDLACNGLGYVHNEENTIHSLS